LKIRAAGFTGQATGSIGFVWNLRPNLADARKNFRHLNIDVFRTTLKGMQRLTHISLAGLTGFKNHF
jgi:hypothetical protein